MIQFSKRLVDPQNKMLCTFLSEELNNKAPLRKCEESGNSLFFCSIYYLKVLKEGLTLILTKLAYVSPLLPTCPMSSNYPLNTETHTGAAI